MSVYQQRLLQVLAVSALAFGLSACGPNTDTQTAGQKIDAVIDKTEQAAETVKVDAERAVNAAGQKMGEAVNASKEAAEKAMDAAGDVGMTAKVNAALLVDPDLSALKIDVDTKDGTVTLHGQTLNQAAKDHAEQLVRSLDGVHAVNNMLTVQ